MKFKKKRISANSQTSSTKFPIRDFLNLNWNLRELKILNKKLKILIKKNTFRDIPKLAK